MYLLPSLQLRGLLCATALGAATLPAQSKQPPTTRVTARVITTIPSAVGQITASPNKRHIYFLTNADIRVYDRTTQQTAVVSVGRYIFLSISPVGDRLLLVRPTGAEAAARDGESFVGPAVLPRRLWTLPIDPATGKAAGDPRPVSMSQATAGRFSPDGQRIAFLSDSSTGGGPGRLVQKLIVTPASGGPEAVIATGVFDSPVNWPAPGNWIYVGGGGGILRVSPKGGTPSLFTPAGERVFPMGWTEGGTHMYGNVSPAGGPMTIAVFDTTGRRVSTSEIEKPDGGVEDNATMFDGWKVLMELTNTRSVLEAVDIKSGKPAVAPPRAVTRGPISPNGRYVVSRSGGPAGTIADFELYDLKTGEMRILARMFASSPDETRWSPDSRYILLAGGVASPQGQRLTVAEIATGKTTVVYAGPFEPRSLAWRKDSKAIRFARPWSGDPRAPSGGFLRKIIAYEASLAGKVDSFPPAADAPLVNFNDSRLVNDETFVGKTAGGPWVLLPFRGTKGREIMQPDSLSGIGLQISPQSSRDGRVLALFGADGTVQVVRDNKGPTLTLKANLRLRSPALCANGSSTGGCPQVLFDGSGLVVVARHQAKPEQGVYFVPFDGTQPRLLYPAGPSDQLSIKLSADQRTVIISGTLVGPPETKLIEVDLAAGKPRGSH